MSLVSLIISFSSFKIPLNASKLPYTSHSFVCEALFTAFSPGQSPPPVKINTFFISKYLILYSSDNRAVTTLNQKKGSYLKRIVYASFIF